MISYFEKVGTSTVDSETCIEIAPPTGMAGNVELNTTASPPAQTFLFDPSTFDAVKKAKNRVREWVLHNLPDALKQYLEKDPAGVSVFVNEVRCGNARCAPVHVSITFVSKDPGNSITIDIPKALADVRQKDVLLGLLGYITDASPRTGEPPTKRRKFTGTGPRSAIGIAARAQNTDAADLLKRIAALMDDFKGGGAALGGTLSSADGEHLDKLLDLLQKFAQMEHTADGGLRLRDVIQLGVPPGLWQLLGMSVEAFDELSGLEEFLASLEDVVVVRKEHYEQLIKYAKTLAATNAQHLHDSSGDAAIIDGNVPLPLKLIVETADAAGTKFEGDDPRILAKLMAEQRQEYLLGLRPRQGERRVCRCGKIFTDSRDVRTHIMKAGPCHEHYVLQLLDESKFYWCSGGCGNDRCGRRQSDEPRRPFFNDTNRRLHEEGAWSRPKAAPRPKHELRQSRYVGVSWIRRTGKWQARIVLKKKRIFYCESHDEELAARERDAYIRRNGLTGYDLNFDESGAFVPKRTSSRFVGVYRTRNKWGSHFKTPKDAGLKFVNVGTFDDEEEAAIAFNKKVTDLGLDRKMKLNKIDPVTRKPIPKDQY